MIGHWYDIIELGNYWLNRLFGVKRSAWKKVLDIGKRERVCSSSAAFIDRFAARCIHGLTHKWEWCQPFKLPGGGHAKSEAVYPADYANAKAYSWVCGGWKRKGVVRKSMGG
jgi:hypothetical protein